MHDPIEDYISDRVLTDDIIPVCDRQLACYDGSFSIMPTLKDFHEFQ
nr:MULTISPECIES: hypothetical protein [unclassified Sphingobacterium]